MSSASDLLMRARLALIPSRPNPSQLTAQAAWTMPASNSPISYKRTPMMDDPQYKDGYPLVARFVGIRGRVCNVYADTTTGEHIYVYGTISRNVI